MKPPTPRAPRGSRAPGLKAVFLAGFMGAGKSSVGRALARRLQMRFVDLDRRIVARHRRTVAQIFRDSGEAGFRRMEAGELRAVLRETAQEPAVVALGGGAYAQPRNAGLLRRAGAPVVFLDAPVEQLRRRAARSAALRPLFRSPAEFRRLYAARRPRYLAADLRVDTGGKSVAQVAAEIESWLLGTNSKLRRRT